MAFGLAAIIIIAVLLFRFVAFRCVASSVLKINYVCDEKLLFSSYRCRLDGRLGRVVTNSHIRLLF